MMNVPQIFGSHVFNDTVMKERLPKEVYKAVRQTIEEGEPLTRDVANVVANAMKKWAIEQGATHYTHWFQPMTGTTAEKHDEMIAFTSQMPHIVSNAFIKSPTATIHKGFSAGSYKDLTRVAWLNPKMWTELFFENKENLIRELDIFIKNLNDYKISLENDDRDLMKNLLEDGKNKKEEVDGNDKR